jgi:mitochondrial fission protein ELM1
VTPALSIRKTSGGKSFCIHVQHPHVNPALFDRVIVASHDALEGPNVFTTQGALHRVTRDKLDDAFARFAPVFGSMRHPIYSVLVGGTTRSSALTAEAARDLGEKLSALAHESGGTLAITMSRRTGAENEAIIRQCLSGLGAYVWDGQGENPYFGLLAHADAIVVTADSVSMTSEACSTGKPVYVFDAGIKSPRIRKFQDQLAATGVTRVFTGKPQTWAARALDDMKAAADFVRPALEKHLGVA